MHAAFVSAITAVMIGLRPSAGGGGGWLEQVVPLREKPSAHTAHSLADRADTWEQLATPGLMHAPGVDGSGYRPCWHSKQVVVLTPPPAHTTQPAWQRVHLPPALRA